MLGRRLRSITRAVQNPEQAAAVLVEIWDNLPQDMIDNVIRSMKRQIFENVFALQVLIFYQIYLKRLQFDTTLMFFRGPSQQRCNIYQYFKYFFFH